MFYKCFEFNQPVTIPESVIDCKGMFHNCKDLNSPIAILSSKTQCFEMFRGCSSMKSPIYCTENQYNDSCLKKLGYTWADDVATYNPSNFKSTNDCKDNEMTNLF